MFWFLLLFYGISRRLTGASVSSSSILDEAPSTNFFFPIVTLWVCFLICCWRDTLHKPEILRYWVFRCRFLSFSGLTFKVPSDQEDFVNLNFPLLWYSRQFVQGNITVNIFKSVWCNDWRNVTEKKNQNVTDRHVTRSQKKLKRSSFSTISNTATLIIYTCINHKFVN